MKKKKQNKMYSLIDEQVIIKLTVKRVQGEIENLLKFVEEESHGSIVAC